MSKAQEEAKSASKNAIAIFASVVIVVVFYALVRTIPMIGHLLLID